MKPLEKTRTFISRVMEDYDKYPTEDVEDVIKELNGIEQNYKYATICICILFVTIALQGIKVLLQTY